MFDAYDCCKRSNHVWLLVVTIKTAATIAMKLDLKLQIWRDAESAVMS